jgi:hypothetical protein
MKTEKYSLSRLLTSHFLFFSWIDLKNNKKLFSNLSNTTSFPISKSWFQKTSLLIRKGKSFYKFRKKTYINKYNFKKKLLINLKVNIIENAIILLLEPYFSKYNTPGLEDFTLTECVR